MRHITIFVPEGQNNISSIAGIHEVLTKANEYWAEHRGGHAYNIQVAGISRHVTFSNGLFAGYPQIKIEDIAATDLVIIPSIGHNFEELIQENRTFIRWATDQYKNGSEIASICTGAFLLASTGLLDGKSCSTHWLHAGLFKKMFPDVILKTDMIISDENGIYTNGGAYSFLNFLIYIIEKIFDRSTAIYCAKFFQIEIDRHSQSEFIIFNGHQNHGDDMVKQAQHFIETKIHERISFADLSSRLSVSRRNFDRRFIKATGLTPLEYSQRMKIESAKKSFETTGKTINEVMYDVGYSDQKAFREIFRKITGMSPLQYKHRYNKHANFVTNGRLEKIRG